MNKYKTNRGRVVFVTLSFSIIAGLMILSANNKAPELSYSEPSTFNEAFSQARALLGSGHAFTWKGQEYTTSYAEELAANTAPVENEKDELESEDDGETKFTADDEDDVYSAVLESKD